VSVSRDPVTRTTRVAANVAAVSVVAFGGLWLLTTQIATIRALSPFADDPWDAVATYAAIFLPFVAGPTWVRSLRHRGPRLPDATSRRIRWGSGVAAAIVFVAAAADFEAIATVGSQVGAGVAPAFVNALVVIAFLAATSALALVARAAMVAKATATETESLAEAPEPDVVDDLLDLATDLARPLGLRRPAERLAAVIERFLDGSAVSPRRHRLLFGVVLALAAAVAFDLWHAIREGPWASFVVPVIFGALLASGVLAIYLGTLGPLRLLRPPPARDLG
jgi:hypothetical protein